MPSSLAQQIIDDLKFEGTLHILRDFRDNAIIGQGMLRTYYELTSEQRATLEPFVAKLTQYLARDRDPNQWRPGVSDAKRVTELRDNMPSPEFITVACLRGPFAVEYKETLKTSAIATLAEKPSAFDEDAMENAANWIVWASDRLEVARQFSPAQQLKILNALLPVDPLDAITLICNALKTEPSIPSTEAAVKSLPAADAKQLGRLALDLYKKRSRSNKKIAADILVQLSCLVPDALLGLHPEIAEFPALYRECRGAIFFNAPAPVSRILQKHTNDADGFLKAMVWTCDPAVPDYLHKLRKQGKKLPGTHVEAYAYAAEGGWELTAAGKRRDLVYDRAFELVNLDDLPENAPPSPVAVSLPRTDNCGNCHHPLTTLLDINLKDKRLSFLGLEGTRLVVATCNTCWDWTYTRTNAAGDVTWLPQSTRFSGGENEFYPWPERPLILGPESRTPIEALLTWGSFIGGHANWINDAYYPPCPDCQQAMMLLAHISLSPLDGDGIIYAWLCPKCRTTATNFRCT